MLWLYLGHDFYNTMFKINLKYIYIVSGSALLPLPKKKNLSAPLYPKVYYFLSFGESSLPVVILD